MSILMCGTAKVVRRASSFWTLDHWNFKNVQDSDKVKKMWLVNSDFEIVNSHKTFSVLFL